MKRLFVFLLLCVLTPAAITVSAHAVFLSQHTAAMEVDERLNLSVLADGAENSVSWRVSDTRVLRFAGADTGGAVTISAAAPGTASVTAWLGDSSAACQVTVSGLSLSASALVLNTGDSASLSLSAFGNAAQSSPRWTSSDLSVVTVQSSDGGAGLRAVGAGNAVITCTAGAYTVSCAVVVSRWFTDPLLDGYLSADGLTLTWWWERKTADADCALCAAYGTDGTLLFIQTLDTGAEQGTYRTAALPSDAAGMDSVKLFVLDRSRRPLCPVRSLNTPGGAIDPAFVTYYPAVSQMDLSFDRDSGEQDRCTARVRVMADQDCILYWALYRRGEGRATIAGLRSGSLPGSLNSGTMPLTRNAADALELSGLAELTSYEVHLWLTTADYTAHSNIHLVPFRTVDCSPPVFLTQPVVTDIRSTSIELSCSLSEECTLYWAALPAGTSFPNPSSPGGTITTESAARQIISGTLAASSGAFPASGNRATTFIASGLSPETEYDIWFTAGDSAGNYAVWPADARASRMVTAATRDTVAPTVSQSFDRTDPDNDAAPYADSDIKLVFSEPVRRSSTGEPFLTLYEAVESAATDTARAAAREHLAEALRNTVKFYESGSGASLQAVSAFTLAPERTAANENTASWVIDYRNALVSREGTRMVVTFPGSGDNAALRLQCGSAYQFRLSDISDTSEYLNAMKSVTLSAFTTVPARAVLEPLALRASSYPDGVDYVDLAFSVSPESTSRADEEDSWDLFLWPDTSCIYEVYTRSRPVSDSYDYTAWRQIQGSGGGTGTAIVPAGSLYTGQSLHLDVGRFRDSELPPLDELRDDRIYEYAVRFRSVAGDSDRAGWNREVTFRVSVVAGTFLNIGNLASNLTQSRWETALEAGTVRDISVPGGLSFRLTRAFADTTPPEFSAGRPSFTPADTTVTMRLQLTRAGTVYYCLAPADGTIPVLTSGGSPVLWNSVPVSGRDTGVPFYLRTPAVDAVLGGRYSGDGIASGAVTTTSGSATVTVDGLFPETDYYACFVLRGVSQNTYSDAVQLFRFTTTKAVPPALSVELSNPVAAISASKPVTLDYIVAGYEDGASLLSRAFWNSTPSGNRSAPVDDPACSGVSTVLDAMSATADDSGRTVFDLYASDNFKAQMASYLREAVISTAGNVIGAGHTITLRSGDRYSVDCSQFSMKSGTRYAVAMVAGSSGGDAFRAVWPVTLPDGDAPKATRELSNSLNMDVSGDTVLDTCSGRVTLQFDEYLWVMDGTTLRQADRGPAASILRDSFPAFAPLSAAVTAQSDRIQLVEEESRIGQPTNTIVLQFDEAPNGAYIEFVLYDADGNTRTPPLQAKIRIAQVRTDVNGVVRLVNTPLLDITTAWDGRR